MLVNNPAKPPTASELAAQVNSRSERSLGAEQPSQALTPPTPSSYFGYKSLGDKIVAGLLLVPAIPVIIFLVALVRLTSRGPGIYSQVRLGKNGREYQMYKIRTMRHDAESRTGAVWTATNDPRITGLGRILRKLHLDEFPQLFNVLRGEMSLIGPRPERPEFVTTLSQAIPTYLHRLEVAPGITGLAQINLPPDSDLDSVRRKVVLDVQYIREATLWLDMRMLLCTMLRLVGFRGDFAMRIMGLHRVVHLPMVAATSAPASTTPESEGAKLHDTVSGAFCDTATISTVGLTEENITHLKTDEATEATSKEQHCFISTACNAMDANTITDLGTPSSITRRHPR